MRHVHTWITVIQIKKRHKRREKTTINKIHVVYRLIGCLWLSVSEFQVTVKGFTCSVICLSWCKWVTVEMSLLPRRDVSGAAVGERGPVGHVRSWRRVHAGPLVLRHPWHQEGLRRLDIRIQPARKQTPVQHPQPLQHRYHALMKPWDPGKSPNIELWSRPTAEGSL